MNGERSSGAERGGQILLTAGVPLLFLIYIFTPQKQAQFASLFLILLVLCSKAYSEYLVRSLRLVRRDKELRAFRNEWFTIELRVENSSPLPAFMLALADSSGGVAVFRNIKSLCTLAGKSRRPFCWEAYGTSRGVFTLGPASIRGSDPLGLFPFTIVFEEKTRLFIYPSPAYAALKSTGGIPLGRLITTDPFYEDLTRRRSLREYHPGDESKRINWKASAKMQNLLLVNEYESSLSYPMVVFLNVDPNEYSLKKRELYIERIIEAAAALCLMASRERQVLGLILHCTAGEDLSINNEIINPAAFTLIPILERLAALEPFKYLLPETPAPAAVDAKPSLRPSTVELLEKGKSLAFGTRLVYLGPAPGEADYEALETLTKRRLSIEYLVIDEKNLEFYYDKKTKGASRKYQIKEWGYAII